MGGEYASNLVVYVLCSLVGTVLCDATVHRYLVLRLYVHVC